ncbi:hypothetical protein [Kytococcus sedentarius]|uniref:hypothetical protein n=1 Tax=Kytococcus sedentarius TaxID=1276 RepID=UPI0035BBA377
MGGAARVAAYLVSLAIVFVAALGAGATLVPDRVVDDWMARSGSSSHEAPDHSDDQSPTHHPDGHE